MPQIEKPPADVAWRDLTDLPGHQVLIELMLPIPWLALSLFFYAGAYWPLGAFGSFMFFLCCLRLNHEAMHSNLGVARRWDHVIMHGLSALLLGSNNANAFCHLRHHKDTLGAGDHEGHCARMTLREVLLYGPRFPIELNRAAWTHGTRAWRRRIAIDWICIVAIVSICLLSGQQALYLHLLAMAFGQCTTAFFAVWITHQGTLHTGLAGRSQRGPLAWLAHLMFYHREHHLFPKVPVSRLPELARRLDAEVPGYAEARVPVTQFLDTR